MSTGSVDHESALRIIHTGRLLAGLPSPGSWVLYGLGSENQNLPACVVPADPGGLPVDGERNGSSGFLPALPGNTVPGRQLPGVQSANTRPHPSRLARD